MSLITILIIAGLVLVLALLVVTVTHSSRLDYDYDGTNLFGKNGNDDRMGRDYIPSDQPLQFA